MSSVFRQQGFSQVELVVVIVVIGILAATLVPRWSASSGFEERAFRDRVVAALRYAQKSAVAARRTVCATFTAQSVTFSIAPFASLNCAGGAALNGPDGVPLVVTAQAPTAFLSVPADIVFDAGGRPLTGAASLSVSTLSAAMVISVEAETGYVH